MAPYQYTSLLSGLAQSPEADAFRIVTLFPGEMSAQLECTLERVSLDSPPAYEALSYVWGRGECPTPLICQSGDIQIKANLELALRRLRYPRQSRRLWIDAICINQQDFDERSQQVLLMRKIYMKSDRVLVWLGPRTNSIEDAFVLASNLSKYSKLVQPAPSDHHASFFELSVVKALAAAEEQELVQPSLFAIAELSDLFDRPWFARIWCVQEVVASRHAIVLCDDLEVPFADVISVAPLVLTFRSRWFSGKPLEFWNSIALQKYGNRPFSDIDGSIGTLEKVLHSTRDFEATDPRDKVFALMGIVNEGLGALGALLPASSSTDSAGMRLLRDAFANVVGAAVPVGPCKTYMPKLLEIDYRKSVMQVYRDNVRFGLRKAPRVVDILCQVQHMSDPATQQDWPSWVPDWSRPRNTSVLGMMGVFHADAKWAIQQDSGLNPAQPDCLFLEGFRYDQVARVTDVIEVDTSDQLEPEILWYQLFAPASIVSSAKKPYNKQESLLTAFFMALIVGELGFILYDGLMSPAWSSIQGNGEYPTSLPQDYERAKRDSAAFLMRCMDLDDDSSQMQEYQRLISAAEGGVAAHYHRIAKAHSFGRRLFRTETGKIGIGPRIVQTGDVVSVLFGGRMPFILRPQDQHYLLIGDSYVRDQELMWGKVSEAVREHRTPFRRQVFEIH